MPTKGDKVARRVGEAFTTKFGLSDNGVKATGKAGTMTIQVYDEAGVAFSTPSVTETPASSGIYSFSFTPDAVGLWSASVVETTIPAFSGWAWDVEATVANDVMVNLKHQIAGTVRGRTPSAQGRTFYWDPTNGNDGNDGFTPETAKATFSSVYGLVTAGAHDTVVLLADSGSALVTITAQIDLNKSHSTLQGPGRAVTFIPTSTTGVTVTLSAESTAIRHLRVETATTGGTADGVLISANDCAVEHCWVEDCQDEGIIVRGSGITSCLLRDIKVRDTLDVGVLIDGLTAAISGVVVEDVIVDAAGSNGVQFLGSTNPITESVARRITAFDCGGRGVVEGTGCSDNSFEDIRGANNALGLISINSTTSRDYSPIAAIVSGVADSGTTTTLVDAARTEADTDYWKGAWIRFTSGSIAGQHRLITAFTPGSDTITFAPALTQAVSTNNYEIIPAAGVDVELWRGVVVNALVSGRVDSFTGEMGTDVVTATAIAADAIGSSELATTAVNEIRDSILTDATPFAGANIATILGDTNDIQTRLPASLVGGRMRSHVEALDADVITAGAIAPDAIGSSELATTAVNEIRDSILSDATPFAGANIATILGDTNDIQTRLPASLNGGRMRSHVEALDADVITAGAIAPDAIGSSELATTAVNEIRDSILSDSTPFAGANINATISSRASQASLDALDDKVDDLVAATIAAELTVASGSSTTEVRTNATQADDFYNDAMIVVLNAAGTAVRRVLDYANTNGAFTVNALPFTPGAGNTAYVVARVAVSGGGGLTQQDVRDAMKLTPTAGAPGAGSVDLHLDDIEADTDDIRPRVVLTEKLLRNRFEISTSTGVLTVYDDNSTTPLLTAQLYEDAAGTLVYDGTDAAHRRNRLT